MSHLWNIRNPIRLVFYEATQTTKAENLNTPTSFSAYRAKKNYGGVGMNVPFSIFTPARPIIYNIIL